MRTTDEVGNPTVINVDTGALTTLNRYFNYDQANRITKEAWRNTTPANIYAFNYQYDEAGNRIAKQRVLPAQTALYWEYDLTDQLTKQKTGSVTRVYFYFDNNGNMSYEHDNNASAGRTYYDYDNRNLLTRVDFPGATATNYYEYNALGERTRKWDSTAAGQFSTWDGIDVIVEKNNALTTVNRYVKGYTPVAGIGAHVMIDPGASGRTWFVHKNQVGTTIKVTDNTGATQNSYQDDAWGQPFLATEGATYRFRFNGKELDPDFILFNSNNRRYHYPARTYVPFRGMFLTYDPFMLVRFPRTTRWYNTPLLAYTYGASSPVTYVDPNGLSLKDMCETAKKNMDWEFKGLFALFFPKCTIDVTCDDCCDKDEDVGSTKKALFVPNESNTTICTNVDALVNRNPAITQTDMNELLRHEYGHAYNNCAGAGSFDCIQIACDEIRAISFSGSCSAGHYANAQGKGAAGEYDQCVKTEAKYSSGKRCRDWVEFIYDKCKIPEGGKMPAWPKDLPSVLEIEAAKVLNEGLSGPWGHGRRSK